VTTRPDFDVLTIGEAMVLFHAQEAGALKDVATFRRYTAGAELNVAVGLARLGWRVAWASKVGDDSFGRILLATLAREGIDAAFVTVDSARSTGFMLKTSSASGDDPQIEYHRRGSAASHLAPTDAPDVRAKHLHLTGILPALSASCRELAFHMARIARAAGWCVSFDPNIRPRLWATEAEMISAVNALAAMSDIVLPGLGEGRLLTGHDDAEDIARFYRDRGVREVAVKLGAEGALCASADGRFTRVPGRPVARVVDTVGAGDGFAVGVISALLDGMTLEQAAMWGNIIGARVVQFPGDCDGLPTREELLGLDGVACPKTT
jgi:2-dehydro-3-deoxygluconokinase